MHIPFWHYISIPLFFDILFKNIKLIHHFKKILRATKDDKWLYRALIFGSLKKDK